MPMRIHMVFGETSILVPCGDGKLTVAELVEKSVVKFKKFIAKHPEDVVEVSSVRLIESGSLVDEDDEVADVLEDKDTVILDYVYYPHRDVNSLNSISDDSAIVGSSSQPYSPSNLDNAVEYTSDGPAHPPLSDKEYEEDRGDELLPPPKSQEDAGDEEQGTPHHSQEILMPLGGHSQDQDLLSHANWTPLTSSQESPHTKATWHHSNEPTTREIIDNQDSGYNTRSQASYGPESQETYNADLSPGHTEIPPSTSSSNTSTARLASSRSIGGSGSQPNLRGGKSKGHRGSKEDIKNTSPPGSKISLFKEGRLDPRRTESLPIGSRYHDHQGPAMDIIPGRFPRGNMYSGFSYDGRPYPPHPPFEARVYPPSDYTPYGSWSYHNDMYHRQQYLMANRRPIEMQQQRDRARTVSTERLDQLGGYPGNRGSYYGNGYRQGIEEEFLSQPNPSFVPQMPVFDPRFPMNGGPSPGVILSQPAMMGGGRSMYGGGDSLERRGGGARRRGYSVDDDLDNLDEMDEMEGDGHSGKGRGRPSPFQRDTRKSMFRDGTLYSQWMERCYEYDIQGEDDLPEYDAAHSQRSRSPSPTPPTDHTPHGDDESDEDDEFGNIHIVELHKGTESLGVYLTHYTSPDGRDLGVFIGDMMSNGFAAQSGELQHQDRILACNGVDFTKEMTNARVEEVFTQMSKEPLLRMAISRGAQSNLPYLHVPQEVGVVSEEGVKVETEPETPSTPKIVSNSSQAPSLTLTNTRQIGVKHTITLTKTTPTSSLGFGVTSRDVMTDNKSVPIYIKSITSGTPAFIDGRLRIGDRLLEVNRREVTGLARSEVVSLLREPRAEVDLVVSRQETIEEQEADEPRPSDTPPVTTTVGKTVLTLDIHLSNTGSAGLGVTVYGRTTLGSGKKTGDMGIYIKSIVPGGAAALDGRLRKNDQLLYVNKEGLLGCANQQALDKLRTALAKASSAGEGGVANSHVELVVARRMCNAGSSQSPSMAALGEEPEEEENVEEAKGREVGIDVPIDARPPPVMSTLTRQSSVENGRHGDGRMERLLSQTSLEHTTKDRGSRGLSGSPRVRHRGQEVAEMVAIKDHSLQPRQPPLRRAEDLMGSGEFDRLEPLVPHSPHSTLSPRQARGRRDLEQSTELKNRPITPQSPVTTTQMHDKLRSWYDDAAASVLPSVDPRIRSSSLDRHRPPPPRDYSTPDSRGQRSHNKPEPSAFYPYQRDEIPYRYRAHTSTDHQGMQLQCGVTSPSDVEVQLSSGQSSREGSIHRSQYPAHYPGQSYGGDNAPTRGSGRKDRNRPERGSGRHQTTPHYSSSSASVSPSISLMMSSSDIAGGSPLTNGYATLPRAGSRSSELDIPIGQSNADTTSSCSLDRLRFSDTESNAAFRRDEPGRISITKKTKKNPRQDFAHMHLNNVEPLVEGEAPVLMRTGSDGCLNESAGASYLKASLGTMELGPQLGLAKSSSLESLHNVMHHTIKMDVVDDGSDLRNRTTRGSFDRAVDGSYDNATPTGEEEQRVSFDLDGSSSVPAVMSYTKNPSSRKGGKKTGFFKKVFTKNKKAKSGGKKERPASISSPGTLHKRGSSVDIILDQENFSEAERELLRTGFTIPIRLGDDSVDDIRIPGDSRYGNSGVSAPQRHSMPIIDDYDSPGSPTNDDDALMSTLAKV